MQLIRQRNSVATGNDSGAPWMAGSSPAMTGSEVLACRDIEKLTIQGSATHSFILRHRWGGDEAAPNSQDPPCSTPLFAEENKSAARRMAGFDLLIDNGNVG
jgi:hypothetical protein